MLTTFLLVIWIAIWILHHSGMRVISSFLLLTSWTILAVLEQNLQNHVLKIARKILFIKV